MTTLAQYERARAVLAEATRIDQILPVMDEIEHVKLYARQISDQALLADASEFQMRAERRLGFVISEAKKAGHFPQHRPKAKNNGNSGEPLPVTLEDVGVSKRLSSTSQKRASISEQAFEATVDGMRARIAAGKARIIEAEMPNGARAIAPGRVEPDDSLDYFPTPPWATRALLNHVLPALGLSGQRLKSAWEPACGEGHIAEVLTEYADTVFATDIFNYGYGAIGDFLQKNSEIEADWIITNPPFGSKTEAFVLRAIELAAVGVAMFVRMQWLETKGRYERIFRTNPPTIIAFFAERVPLCKGEWKPDGDTLTAYVWLIWMKGCAPQAPFWIPPDCRDTLSLPDDADRFTSHPVVKAERLPPHDPETGEIIAGDQQQEPQPPNDRDEPSHGTTSHEPPEADDDLDIPAFLRRSAVTEAEI